MMEVPYLEVTQQNLNYLNSDLERDLHRLAKANQALRKIQEKEESIQSLNRDIALSVERVKERKGLNQLMVEKEEALREVELQQAKLEKKNLILSRNVAELEKKVSRRFKNDDPDKGTLKQLLAELKVKLQMLTESCAKQEKEMAKVESNYQTVRELCKVQAHYIKKYQEILGQMEKEKEGLLLIKETHFQYLFFTVMIFMRLLGYVCFHLQYINPDLLVNTLPMLMSRSNLK